jgi:hypothetical protein
MIDKKVLLLIVVLVIVAVVVLAASMLSPATIRGGGSSFSALFDKMEINSGTEADLVLPSTYMTGEVITITDTVASMEVRNSGSVTRFYFDYVGTKWVNETGGTDFSVVQDVGKIEVSHAQFYIEVSGDLHMSAHVGKSLTLQTTVALYQGDQVLRHNWVPILS